MRTTGATRRGSGVCRHFAIVALLLGGLIAGAKSTTSSSPYAYDEADYMFAIRLGLAANYTDTPTMGIGEFLRMGLTRGKDARQSSGLSELIRGGNDIVFYRHWHGPLYFYALLLPSLFDLDEYHMRLSMLVFPIGSLLLIYFGCLWILPGIEGELAAVLSSALFAWSVTTLRSTELAPHQAFVCCYLAALICLARTITTGSRSHFYFAVIAAALGCCLLEVGFVIVATLLVCGFLERRALRADWGFAVRSLLLFGSTVLLVWPGAIFKLSFLKGYLFMAYLAFFRKSPWGSAGLLDTWRDRLMASPLEWLVLAVGVLMFMRKRKTEPRALYPFAIYSVLMLAATLRVTSTTARYALPFQPALELLAGCALAIPLAKLRAAHAYALAGLLSLSLLVAAALDFGRRPPGPDERATALLSFIPANHLERSWLMAPQSDVPTLHYYFPDIRLRGYTGEPPNPSETGSGAVDGILYPDFPLRYHRLAQHD